MEFIMIWSKILLYAIVAFVVIFTFLGIKRMFQVFFVSGSCCSSKKGLGANLGKGKKKACACGKDNCTDK